MSKTHFATCSICEASCGLEVEVEGDRIVKLRGDRADSFSLGHVCPKMIALKQIHEDPDRLRRPVKRIGKEWKEIDWDEALDLAAGRIAEIQEQHGNDAVGIYLGNPTAHDHGVILLGTPLLLALKTRNRFTANSVDGLPRMLVSYLLYGSQSLVPVPDIDRTRHLLILGGNPAVSNSSAMCAPGVVRRLKALRARGGKIVLIDPRRTETAKLADAHHFIRPGTDALFQLSMLNVLFAEGLTDPGHLDGILDGAGTLPDLAKDYPPERTAPLTGVAADTVRSLTRDFAAAESAVCYGRMGTCVQEFGAVSTWLCDVINALTGNLDRPGGAMFTTPAVDLPKVLARIGESGQFDTFRTRVSDLPEFAGELPVAALAEEIDTPGQGQIRALITHAGNPVLSCPNGRRLDKALSGLDFMVAIDIYVNETTRHADLILPSTFGLERDHYSILSYALAVRNYARFSPAAVPAAEGTREGWEILVGLAARLLGAKKGMAGRVTGGAMEAAARRLGPNRILDLLLRLGPYRKLNLKRLEAQPHGMDFGALEPRLPDVIQHADHKVQIAHETIVNDLKRLAGRVADWESAGTGARTDDQLWLITRRSQRSNNTWLHNCIGLVRGKHRCTLRLSPTDASRREIRNGDEVQVSTDVGDITVTAEVSEEMMPGVASMPFGWGHDRPGVELAVAGERPGVSLNDVLDERRIDVLSGCSDLNGQRVRVEVTPAGPPGSVGWTLD